MQSIQRTATANQWDTASPRRWADQVLEITSAAAGQAASCSPAEPVILLKCRSINIISE